MKAFYPLALGKQGDGIFQQQARKKYFKTHQGIFTKKEKLTSILLMSNNQPLSISHMCLARHYGKQSLDLCNSLIATFLLRIHTVNVRHLPGFRQPQHQACDVSPLPGLSPLSLQTKDKPSSCASREKGLEWEGTEWQKVSGRRALGDACQAFGRGVSTGQSQ